MATWWRLNDISANLRVLLAIVSFLLYATTVITLHQYRDMKFIGERNSVAGAVSTVVYNAPLGMSYAAVLDQIRDANIPLAAALERTLTNNPAQGLLIANGGADGNGIGYLLIATLAMLVFGPHIFSPTLMMLMLMAISGAAFLWRFGPDSAAAVVIYFIALTLLIFTHAVYLRFVAEEVPIAGIRYFSVVGILPALHIAMELIEPRSARLTMGWGRFCILTVQVVILGLIVLTRSSNAAFLGVIGALWVFRIWRSRHDRPQLRRQISNGACVGLAAGGLFMLIILMLPPNFLSDGRLTGVVWNRAFVGFGYHPEWPFGNLRETYKCNYEALPGWTLEPGPLDTNGACVWFHYLHAHPDFQRDGVSPYGIGNIAQYERVLRDATLDVIRHYPRQVLETEVYYKVPMLWAEFENAIFPPFRLSEYSDPMRFLFFAAWAILLLLIIMSSLSLGPSQNFYMTGLSFLFGLSVVPGYLIAWPGTSQTLDMKVLVLLTVGLGIAAIIEAIVALLLGKMSSNAPNCAQ